MSSIDVPEGTGAVERWQAPSLGGADGDETDSVSLGRITIEKIERTRRHAYKEAYDEAYAKGFSQGEADGLAKLQPHLKSLLSLRENLESPFSELDTEIEHQLSHLAILIAKQISRREIDIEPGQIIAIVREAIKLLPVNATRLTVCVHPSDLQMLKSVMELNSEQSRLSIAEDVALQRGDCKVFTEYSSIDATLDTRLTALVAQMLGGNRSGDEEQ